MAQEAEFSGVFHFTNNSEEDFVVLWNNKEYTFPAKSCSPIIIAEESPEHIQEIRKKWAYKWAEREWFRGSEYKKMAKMGGGLPPMRDDKNLEPLIQMCLNPLSAAKVKVSLAKKDTRKIKASKVVDDKANLNEEFKDEEIETLGKQAE